MNGNPVRLVVTDDLRRRRASVFFRLLLAIPYLLWLALWAVAALFFTIANWVATLLLGRSPAILHEYLANFVRLSTHVHAYLFLAAEPLPGLLGNPGYPVDVEIDPPARQNRWTVAIRLLLALPALLLAGALLASGPNFEESGLAFGGPGLALTAAFLGWFAALARARMPHGLRDAVVYGISYAAQLWTYLLVMTDRYPFADPLRAIDRPPTVEHPLRLESGDDLGRSRLTVFFRALLALPHFVWLLIWGVAVLPAAIGNWFATLFSGTSPRVLHRFLAAYVRYQLHVGAFLYLVANPFPGFVGEAGRYPVDLTIAGAERQNRWTVGFRLVLAVPALLLSGAYGAVAFIAAFLGWFAALFTGRMPAGLRNAGALALRYMSQTYAYVLLVTGAYPYGGPCVAPPPGTGTEVEEPAPLPADPR